MTIEDNINKASELEGGGDFFAASFYYKQALQLAIKTSDSANIKILKNKLVEVNKKSIKSGKDFKEISIEHKISEDDAKKIDELINKYIALADIYDILEKIGNSPSFCPKLDAVKETAKRTTPVSYAFANISTISNIGHVVPGSNIGDVNWLMKMYDISQQIILNLYLIPLFKKLLTSDGGNQELNQNNLFEYFQKKGLIDDCNIELIKNGLESYFLGDYVSCLHVLIPQFESVFLSLSEKCGIDIVALDQKLGVATRTKTLSDRYLSSDEFVKIWGEDFCFQLRFILFEPLGYKLRHKTAHGEITKEECNFSNCSLIIYFFLNLLGRVKPITDRI